MGLRPTAVRTNPKLRFVAPSLPHAKPDSDMAYTGRMMVLCGRFVEGAIIRFQLALRS